MASVSRAALALSLSATASLHSQGPEIPRVSNTGSDRPLPWVLVETFRIGPSDSGPSSFSQVPSWAVSADHRGRLYVLDLLDPSVEVFDSTGRWIRNMGRRGGGPGEMRRPVSLAAAAGGEIAVVDFGKGALVRFDSVGEVVPQLSVPVQTVQVAIGEDRVILALGPSPVTVSKLIQRHQGAEGVVATVDAIQSTLFSKCGIAVPAGPYFAPTIRWASTGRFTAVSSSSTYEVALYLHGRHHLTLTRSISPSRITRAAALAAPEVQAGFTIRSERGECRLSPEELLAARGFHPTQAPVQALRVTPHGEVWVRAQRTLGGPAQVDVFASDGRYIGTLSSGTPFPAAFLGPDLAVAVRADGEGVPYLVGYRIDRRP